MTLLVTGNGHSVSINEVIFGHENASGAINRALMGGELAMYDFVCRILLRRCS